MIKSTQWQPEPLENRAERKYSAGEQCRRIAWAAGQWLIRLSPRPFFGWRRFVLRMFGAQVGKHVHVYPSTKLLMPWNVHLHDMCALGEDVYLYSIGDIRIGRSAVVSYRSHLCAATHDYVDPKMPLLRLPVAIGENAWIGTEAFIGPGVTIGVGAVVGARAVVVKDVAPHCIVAGNPARHIGMRVSSNEAAANISDPSSFAPK